MIYYKKPYKTFEEQLDLLKQRGMVIADDQKALSYLSRIGYYRLSAYWHPFWDFDSASVPEARSVDSKRPHKFLDGTNFASVIKLYAFDKKLRLLFLDALERIEVAFRTDIAYHLGKIDIFAHLRPEILDGNFVNKKRGSSNSSGGPSSGYEIWVKKYEEKVSKSKEGFAIHFKDHYGGKPPIWVAVELWDFGALSHFYAGMKHKDRMAISMKYGLQDEKVLRSWLQCLNFIRNIAAHHSRLWNRNLVSQPKLPKQEEVKEFSHLIGNSYAQSRIYAAASIIKYLLDRINPTTSWAERLKEHLDQFPENTPIALGQAGFPDDWHDQSLWADMKNTKASETEIEIRVLV